MRFAIVGNGKMAIDILGVLGITPRAEVMLCLGDRTLETAQSRLAKACADRNIDYFGTRSLNEPGTLAALTSARPDYIVSANNYLIFKPAALHIPRLGVLNFHNGPLPRHGGLNACSWAIAMGETTHGVVWHMAEEGIDTGPIVARTSFALGGDETAIGLISRCIEAGVDLFGPLAARLVAGAAVSTPQTGERLYHGRRDLPWNGVLPWREPMAVLERLSRAIDFHPTPNTFYRPKLAARPDSCIWVEGFSVEPGPAVATPGTIVSVEDDEIEISVLGGSIVLRQPLSAEGAPHDTASLARLGFGPGGSLLELA